MGSSADHMNLSRLITESNRKPLMLKDFLRDDSSSMLPRSRTRSALHRLVNLVKMIPFASTRIMNSNRVSKECKAIENGVSQDTAEEKVKIKDILRWSSFQYTGESLTDLDRMGSVSTSCRKRDSNHTLMNAQRGEWWFEDSAQQQSPVSVLDDSPFLEDDESISPSYAERKWKQTQTNRDFDIVENAIFEEKLMANAVEEKAKKLLNQLQATIPHENIKSHANLMLDFLEHELSTSGKHDDIKFGFEILEAADSWMNGEFEEIFVWDIEKKRESFVKDMERGMCWNKFRNEKEEVAKLLQFEVLDVLIDEILYTFIVK